MMYQLVVHILFDLENQQSSSNRTDKYFQGIRDWVRKAEKGMKISRGIAMRGRKFVRGK